MSVLYKHVIISHCPQFLHLYLAASAKCVPYMRIMPNNNCVCANRSRNVREICCYGLMMNKIYVMSFYPTGTRCRWSQDGRRSCYKVFAQRKTWSDARTYCQALYDGADLVSIETHAEDLFLVYMTQGEGLRRCGKVVRTTDSQSI